jgi:hypothetical protein
MHWAERFASPEFTSAFWEGREFRTFLELNIPAGTTLVMRVVVPVDTVFYGLELTLDSGHLRMGTYAGGTEGGTFSVALPIFRANNMSAGENRKDQPSAYVAQDTLHYGGTHTGGTELDVQRIRPAKDSSTGNGAELLGDARGIQPGTYYFRLLALVGPVTGVFRARWEERPTTP